MRIPTLCSGRKVEWQTRCQVPLLCANNKEQTMESSLLSPNGELKIFMMLQKWNGYEMGRACQLKARACHEVN